MTPRARHSTFIRVLTEAATVRPFMNTLLALKRTRVAQEGPLLRVPAPEQMPVPVAA